MSSIDKLKAEAVALRETEREAGRELKHSEALEQVAKRHGYANWRACAALLGEGEAAPAPVSSLAPDGTGPIRPSRLLAGESESARNDAFTGWLSPGLAQAAVDFSRNVGLLPLFAETSDQGARYLFWNMPKGALCEVRSGRTRAEFLDLDRRNREHARTLVALHVSGQEQYSAVWISPEFRAAAVRHLGRFGIGPAETA